MRYGQVAGQGSGQPQDSELSGCGNNFQPPAKTAEWIGMTSSLTLQSRATGVKFGTRNARTTRTESGFVFSAVQTFSFLARREEFQTTPPLLEANGTEDTEKKGEKGDRDRHLYAP